MKKRFMIEFPEVMEWFDSELNPEIDPSEIHGNDHTLINWRCVNNPKHVISSDFATRKRRNVCIYCSRKVAFPGETDLGTTHPHIAETFHHEKNQEEFNIKVTDLLHGSAKKYWWKCQSCNSDYMSAVANRVAGKGCSFCGHKKINETNALSQHEAARFFDEAKNLKIFKKELSEINKNNTIHNYWWKCEHEHEWKDKACVMSENPSCPYCDGRKSWVSDRCFLFARPEVEAELYDEMNQGLDYSKIPAKSTQPIWWKCPDCNSAYKRSPSIRVLKMRNCLYCENVFVNHTNALAFTHPLVAKEFYHSKNLAETGKTVYDISFGHDEKVWWKCSENPKHIYKSGIRYKNVRCILCYGRYAVPGETDVFTTHPHLKEEWDFEKNTEIDHLTVKAASKVSPYWICSKDNTHKWKTPISSRTKSDNPTSCPYCNGKIVKGVNNFSTTHPELFAMINKNLTVGVDLESLSKGSHVKVWWNCEKNSSHQWEAACHTIAKGHGCPRCSKNVSKGEKALGSFVRECLNKLHNDSEILLNNRKVIKPKELDIYIPELSLAFEFNGNYWHDKKAYLEDVKNSTNLSREMQKTLLCEVQGITLIHVWEDNWKSDKSCEKERLMTEIEKHIYY